MTRLHQHKAFQGQPQSLLKDFLLTWAALPSPQITGCLLLGKDYLLGS